MMAQGLAANGAKVYLCSRKADACDQAAAALNDQYGDGCAVSLPGDLSTIEGVQAVVDAFQAQEDALSGPLLPPYEVHAWAGPGSS